jgi:hypothetical protein
MDQPDIVDVTRRWIASMVIGLNLCPFAQRVFNGEKIRYVVTEARDESALLQDLRHELEALASAPRSIVETTLLIHPHVLANFLDYNDFLGPADRLLKGLGLRGTIQIASFHPLYRFANTEPDGVENYTNRSPFPMLHLLREQSISEVAAESERLGIPFRNIETLKAMGKEKVLQRLAALTKA